MNHDLIIEKCIDVVTTYTITIKLRSNHRMCEKRMV